MLVPCTVHPDPRAPTRTLLPFILAMSSKASRQTRCGGALQWSWSGHRPVTEGFEGSGTEGFANPSLPIYGVKEPARISKNGYIRLYIYIYIYTFLYKRVVFGAMSLLGSWQRPFSKVGRKSVQPLKDGRKHPGSWGNQNPLVGVFPIKYINPLRWNN